MSEKIVCVTNRILCRGDFLERIDCIAAHHPKAVILREKDLSKEEYIHLAEEVLQICQRYAVPCILHTFFEEALQLEADAIHLPLPLLRTLPDTVRKQFSVLGTSCHSLEDAQEAKRLGCTYLVAGHIYETDCKRDLPGRGLSFLRTVCETVELPVYAIGGINIKRLPEILQAGASGGCVMSGLMTCELSSVSDWIL